MNKESDQKDKFFIRFDASVNTEIFPEHFVLQPSPHPLALQAAKELQQYLKTQTDWKHNFGLSPGQNGAVIGKMFGVLVVKNIHGEIGYLSAFSGKLAGGNKHLKFVPPVFDSLTDQSFLNVGMKVLTELNIKIKALEKTKPAGFEVQIKTLKITRSKHSNELQHQLFNNYYFLNKAGEQKSLTQIFQHAGYKNPPSGAGECAGPKLLQYAFMHQMEPLALTEFWWGLSPKSAQWKHGHFYPCCKEKCEPIFHHMLKGLVIPPILPNGL